MITFWIPSTKKKKVRKYKTSKNISYRETRDPKRILFSVVPTSISPFTTRLYILLPEKFFNTCPHIHPTGLIGMMDS
jgi:hypothetical protein